SGDILTRLTSDVSSVAGGVINTMPSIIALFVQLITAFFTLFYFEPYLALLAFVLGPVTILFSRFWGRKIKKLQVKVQESESAYRSYIQEALQNLLVIKSFRLEEMSESDINALHQKRMQWIISRNKTSILASTVLGAGYWAGYFMAFAWGAMRLAQKATTFGTLAAFLQLVQQVQGPFLGLSRTVPQVIASIASAGRLMELEEIPLEKANGFGELPESVGIELQDVDFGYSDESEILRKVSVNVRPGEIVAVMGPSGEGKTTIIRLILALASPQGGRVLFKGTNGCEYSACAETRDLIAYVPQGNTLFSGTIEENIRCGNKNAALEEIKNAAVAASAWDFISELDEGLNTVIGERGIGLSEGQAQRIAIARAILRNAPILILDEATSALDVESEMHVLEAIKNTASQRTCIVVTHRPSALKICNRVLRLEKGNLLDVTAVNY
ncbi:MAG TPA: ABC transporter ATP-binding protein, partial [Clostridia bacterium]